MFESIYLSMFLSLGQLCEELVCVPPDSECTTKLADGKELGHREILQDEYLVDVYF